MILLLDADSFLRLDCLMEAIRPPPTLEDAAGELVDDLDLSSVNDVILVSSVEILGT